jgi:hypothetical protein
LQKKSGFLKRKKGRTSFPVRFRLSCWMCRFTEAFFFDGTHQSFKLPPPLHCSAVQTANRNSQSAMRSKCSPWNPKLSATEKPEQADLVESIKATIGPNMKPERHEQAVVTQAKNFIRKSGIKLGSV